jgi:hypothetical protein
MTSYFSVIGTKSATRIIWEICPIGEKVTVVQASFLLQYQDFRGWVCDRIEEISTKISTGEGNQGEAGSLK